MTHSTKRWNLWIVSLMILSISTINIENLHAVPAKPGVISVKQADGTSINIKIYGDEFFNWRTTESGYTIVEKSDGLYYYADYSESGKVIPLDTRVSIGGKIQTPPSTLRQASAKMPQIAQAASSQKRAAAAQSSSSDGYAAAFPSSGTIKAAVILVQYADVSFSVANPNEAFTNQLNQEGYSVSGATGSAKDYFSINSKGQFDGQFDVYGPYTLANNRSYYGANDDEGYDLRPAEMIAEAAALADADGVDFSQYDADNDGYIDNIFVYYAGHNEAEGASSDTIWPHKWAVSSQPSFDGKRLYIYACTSELRNASGSTIAGIGTFCHEFSHVFGLADHYDTDGSTNGTSQGLGTYDIMTTGSYNNSGNTPPLLNGLELDMIGWNTPIVFTAATNVTQQPIQDGKVYKILTDVTDEYFLLEVRSKSSTVWENYLASDGLIITHVDRSTLYMYLWNQNGPNNNTSHECFRFIVAGDEAMTGYNWSKVPYPYLTNNSWTSISSPAAVSWSGSYPDINVIDIEKQSDGSVTYKTVLSSSIINILVSCDQDAIYVDDPVQITATYYPTQEDNTFTWSSSNEAIATVDNDGVALFSQAGSVTFTATSNIDSEVSGSIELTAINFQGAKGYIYSRDSETLADASLTFYPATLISGVSSKSFTRTSGASSSSTVSDENGEYLIELDEGYYEVEISCSQHSDLFEIVEIKDGSNSRSFTLENLSQVVDEISIEVGQTDATIIWNPQSYTKFFVSLLSSSGTTTEEYVSESRYTIDYLNTSSTYTITIYGVEGSTKTEIYNQEFTTLSKATTIPMIYLEEYEYSSGEVLELKIINSSSSDVITWFFDKVELSSNKVILDVGEHTIQAEVVRGSSTYRANRVINVK